MKINIVIEPKLLPTACSRLMEKKTETAVITHWLYSMLMVVLHADPFFSPFEHFLVT